MREIPIIVFINKLDREGKDGFDLLDELEKKLNFKVCPLSFPIGMGYDFSGIYNIFDDKVSLLKGNEIKVIDKNEVKNNISEDLNNQFIDNLELLEDFSILLEKMNKTNKDDVSAAANDYLKTLGLIENLIKKSIGLRIGQ